MIPDALIARVLAGAIQIYVGVRGVKAAGDLADEIRASMVEHGRAPTEEELAGMMDRLRSRSAEIQNA